MAFKETGPGKVEEGPLAGPNVLLNLLLFNFDFDDMNKDSLKAAHIDAITKKVVPLVVGKSNEVKVHGFASKVGASDYNLKLSAHRSNKVARQLAAAGVKQTQIIVRPHGEEPSTSKSSDDERDRAVRVLVFAGSSPTPTPGGVVIVPFTSRILLIQAFDDPMKSDLDAADPPRIPLTRDEAKAIAEVNLLPTPVLQRMMQGELFVMAQALGNDMFEDFKANNSPGAPITFADGSPLAEKVAGTEGFAEKHKASSSEFDAIMKKQFASGRVDVSTLEATTSGTFQGRPTLTNPAGLKTFPIVTFSKSEVALHAVIGGQFQGAKVTLEAFTGDAAKATYKATLRYALRDHFGVDNSDTVFDGFHGSPGQKAFWVLQHRRHPGHNPYVTEVVITREITGSFK
jgi:hypothetical protein